MAVKAKLKLILMADDVVVAESEDPDVWKTAFVGIHGGGSPGGATDGGPAEHDTTVEWVSEEDRLAVRAFAKGLDVDVRDVLAACHPRTIAPYIFLSKECWEAFKRNTPERGRNAVSNAVLAVTLLLLWAERIHLERVSLRDAYAVLRTIGARDEHASRAVENCSWLTVSFNRIRLNPAEASKAVVVARAFCLKEPPQWADADSETA
jgi:hypothetical protein